jgi:ankyrin repeat protein
LYACCRFLVHASPELVDAPNYQGETPLHLAASKPSVVVDEIAFLGNAWPPSIRTRDTYGRLPIHRACDREQPNLPVIKYLVDTWPPSLLKLDLAYKLPLHHACDSQYSQRIIQYLVDSKPESVWIKDYWGHLPLETWKAHERLQKEEAISHLLGRQGKKGGSEHQRRHSAPPHQPIYETKAC